MLFRSNKVLMLENSIYSILSPEGYASILWKDASLASEAASVMKLTSYDLYENAIIDEIITEPLGGAHFDSNTTFKNTKIAIEGHLDKLLTLDGNRLKEERYLKYRNFGFFQRFNYDNLKDV